MEFRKERNLIVAYDGVLKVGAWNISNGTFVGKSGTAVKSVPKCFIYDNLPSFYNTNSPDNLLGYAIRRYRSWKSGWNFEYTTARANRFEQLISVGLMTDNLRELDTTISLNKEIVTYLKEHNRGYYSSGMIQRYLTEKKYAEILKDKPEWYRDIFKALVEGIPADYLKTILNRAEHEHVMSFYGDYNTHGLWNVINDYYKICMKLYGKVEVKPNILSNYAQLVYLNNEYEKAHYNDKLREYNDKAWLYYQNDNFIVTPILTKEEFHREGERQNNCVERMYMEKVYNGHTHVVTIRRVSDPDKNYITCEVLNNGKINQYLTKNNNRPTDPDAIEFQKIYQQHLKEALATAKD